MKKITWLVFLLAFLSVLAAKGVSLGWFEPRPLELGGQPVLLFFNAERGCECSLAVYRAADAQIADWDIPAGLTIHQVDFERRPDLAQQYDIVRAFVGGVWKPWSAYKNFTVAP